MHPLTYQLLLIKRTTLWRYRRALIELLIKLAPGHTSRTYSHRLGYSDQTSKGLWRSKHANNSISTPDLVCNHEIRLVNTTVLTCLYCVLRLLTSKTTNTCLNIHNSERRINQPINKKCLHCTLSLNSVYMLYFHEHISVFRQRKGNDATHR